MAQQLKESKVAAKRQVRTCGEAFVMLLPDIKAEAAMTVAEQISESIARHPPETLEGT